MKNHTVAHGSMPIQNDMRHQRAASAQHNMGTHRAERTHRAVFRHNSTSRDNQFEITATDTGSYVGRCAELCGTYHSQMNFEVRVVSPSDYQRYLSALASFEGDTENVTDIFVLDTERRVQGVVALSKMMLTPRETKLGDLPVSHVVCAAEDANGRKVAELFDKYNLRCLAVLNEENRLAGVVHAENVIAWLRNHQ